MYRNLHSGQPPTVTDQLLLREPRGSISKSWSRADYLKSCLDPALSFHPGPFRVDPIDSFPQLPYQRVQRGLGSVEVG